MYSDAACPGCAEKDDSHLFPSPILCLSSFYPNLARYHTAVTLKRYYRTTRVPHQFDLDLNLDLDLERLTRDFLPEIRRGGEELRFWLLDRLALPLLLPDEL